MAVIISMTSPMFCGSAAVMMSPMARSVALVLISPSRWENKWSENKLHRELNITWAATAEERIADAHVGCDGDREKARAAAGHGIDRRSHVGGKTRQQRIREVWMVEDVEDFGAQLQPQFLRQLGVLEDREVDVVITRTTQRIA